MNGAPRRARRARGAGAAGRAAAALVAVCLAAGAGIACGGTPAEPDEVFERVRSVADEAEAERAVAAMLSAYGGFDTWSARHNAEYRFALALYAGDPAPRRTTHQIHRLALGTETHIEIEDLAPGPPLVTRIDEGTVTAARDGAPVEPDDPEFRRAYGIAVRWDFRLPWSLLDPDMAVTGRGTRTPAPAGPVPAGPCDVVRVRFQDGSTLGSSDDWHDVYISRRSHLVEQVHTYRAGPNDYRLSVWSDHRDFDGIRVATRRATYASDAAATVGRLEAVAEYADVRFDVDWRGGSAGGGGP